MTAAIAHQYWALTKPRVVALIVFTAIIGMFLATPDLPPLNALFHTVPLHWHVLLPLLALASAVLWAEEARKLVARRMAA